MTEKTINISKKDADGNIIQADVTLAYCYATEIAFKDLSGGDITDFMQEAIENIQQQRMPDIKKTIYLIIAAHMAYTEANGIKEPAIKDLDLMTTATPDEVGTALGIVIGLRAEFYHVPAGEPEDKPDKGNGGRKRKNA